VRRSPLSFAIAVASVFGAAACSSSRAPVDDFLPPSTAPVVAAVGELHLHQFPLGSHAWAAFVDAPVPLSQIAADELAVLQTKPTEVVSGCELYLPPRCSPSCAPNAFCEADGVCKPLPLAKYVDAGDVRVTGSVTLASLRLFYDPASGSYASDPPPGATKLFDGGERLLVHGGHGRWSFEAAIPAPKAVVVNAPDLSLDLHLPLDAPFEIVWQSESASSIVVTINASGSDGEYGYVRCATSDTGKLTVPRDMMAALPRPPRDIRLEVERQEQKTFPTATDGLGVIVHAAQSTWKNGAE
jgi:hypothetical protein